jgi:hypothetical protein
MSHESTNLTFAHQDNTTTQAFLISVFQERSEPLAPHSEYADNDSLEMTEDSMQIAQNYLLAQQLPPIITKIIRTS